MEAIWISLFITLSKLGKADWNRSVRSHTQGGVGPGSLITPGDPISQFYCSECRETGIFV